MESGTCEYCGASLKLLRAGARFCSPKHRVYASRARKLPAEMTALPRWVRWRPVVRGARTTKMPVMLNGRPASSTDPGTWSTYDAVSASQVGAGPGFVLGEGIGCIDLDHCLSDGELAAWAAEIVASNRGTYVEVSQSGAGLHIFGLMPEGRGRVIRDGRNIELYSAGRFIAVTANRWAGHPPALSQLRLEAIQI